MASGMNAPIIDWAESRPYKLRLTDVEVLQRAGTFDDGPRVELIEGVLIAVSPQLRAHSFLKNELTHRFRMALSGIDSTLSAQSEVTVQISPTSAPEPDIALTNEPNGEGYVPVASVALLVEIANSTLRFDLGDKRDIYAAAGVPEYWVVDVNKAEVHRFADLTEGAYRPEPPIPLAGALRSLTMPDLRIDGAGIV